MDVTVVVVDVVNGTVVGLCGTAFMAAFGFKSS